MQPVRIKGYTFSLSVPYSEGSVLTKGEAQALNALRIENICNNLRDLVNKAIGVLPEGELLSEATIAEIQAAFTKYDQGYTFAEKHIPRPKKGLLESEAQLVAEERVDAEARRLGRELSELEREQLVEEYIELPAVKDEARARASAKARASTESLESLLG